MKINLKLRFRYALVFIVIFLASLFLLHKFYPINMEVHLKSPQAGQHFLYYEQLGNILVVEGAAQGNVVKYRLPMGIGAFSFLTEYDDNITGISFNDKPVSFAAFADDYKSVKRAMLGWLCLLALGIGVAGTTLTYAVVWLIRHEKELAGNKSFAKLENVLTIALMIIIALSYLMRILYVHPVDNLDLSWIWALDYIKDADFSFGKDITFTYGPLGYLLTPAYYKTTPLAVILVVYFIVAQLALLIIYNRTYNKRNLSRLVIWGLVYVLFCWVPTSEWAWNFLLLFLLMLVLVLRDNPKYFLSLSAIAGIVSAISLFLKFNSALLAVGMGGFLGVILLVAYRKYFLRYFWAFSICYLVVAIIGVAVFFDGFADFINWVQISLEISKGFSYAFWKFAMPYYYGLLIIVMLLYVFVFVLGGKGGKDFVSLAIFSLAFVFFAYKHGFTRADSHMYSFFSMMPLVMGLLYLFASARISKIVLALFVVCAVICSLFAYPVMYGKRTLPAVVDGVNKVIHYNEQLAENNASLQNILSDYVLPMDWRAEIGDNSIQLLPWDLLYVPANDLKGWQPNPILQIYSAYTHKLDNISAASLSNADAPEYVLVDYDNSGLKKFYLNNPATWNAVFANYEVEKYDKTAELMLLKRKAGEIKPPAFESLGTHTYNFDQWIEIPVSENPVYARIKTQFSLYGKIVTTFFRGSRSVMIIQMPDGTRKVEEIINDSLYNPTLISHVPFNFEQMLVLATKENPDAFKVGRIMITNPNPRYYRNFLEIEWLELTND